MTEPDTREPEGTQPESPDIDALVEMSFTILSELLKVYGLEEDGLGKDGTEKDYKIEVNREDTVLALDINAYVSIRGILIGRGGSNVLALERILISALYRRLHLEGGQRLGRTIRLSVNGTRPDTRRANGDEERPTRGERSSAGQRPVVIVTFPPDVEVLTRVAR